MINLVIIIRISKKRINTIYLCSILQLQIYIYVNLLVQNKHWIVIVKALNKLYSEEINNNELVPYCFS